MGRLPEPNKLRVVKGKAARDVPTPVPVLLEPPDDLKGDGRELWARVAPELERLGLLSGLDRSALEAMCVAYGQWRQAVRELDGMPLVVETERGWRKNPLTTVARAASDEMRQWAVQLGLTPAARLRMVRPEASRGEEESVFGGEAAR